MTDSTAKGDPAKDRAIEDWLGMPENFDSSEICRHEDCTIEGVHRKHLVSKHQAVKPHHRPSNKRPVWRLNDPSGLTGAVARATSKAYPIVFSGIVREVRDDYGEANERTIYRHVRKLVERGHLIKLDLGLTFAAYIRPKSRLLKDPNVLREFLLCEYDFGKSCARLEGSLA